MEPTTSGQNENYQRLINLVDQYGMIRFLLKAPEYKQFKEETGFTDAELGTFINMAIARGDLTYHKCVKYCNNVMCYLECYYQKVDNPV